MGYTMGSNPCSDEAREIDVLHERIAELEQENERLKSPDLRTLYGYEAGFKAGMERAEELEQENERLRKYQLKVLDDQYRQGMERAAELKEQVRVDCSAMPNSSIDAALQHYERAIRAELNR